MDIAKMTFKSGELIHKSKDKIAVKSLFGKNHLSFRSRNLEKARRESVWEGEFQAPFWSMIYLPLNLKSYL